MDGLAQRQAVRSGAAHSSLSTDQEWLLRMIGDGYTPARIARMLQVTPQAVSQMLARARAHFQKAA